MTIQHRTKTQRVTNEYHNNTLTRVIDSTIYTLDLKHRQSREDLIRLSSIDDESFKMMAQLNNIKKD
jgi:hypothetical protein